MIPRQPFLPMNLTGCRIKARRNVFVVDHEELMIYDNWWRNNGTFRLVDQITGNNFCHFRIVGSQFDCRVGKQASVAMLLRTAKSIKPLFNVLQRLVRDALSITLQRSSKKCWFVSKSMIVTLTAHPRCSNKIAVTGRMITV